MASPRVLVICSFTPFPTSGGDSVRVMGILRALAKRTDLTVWCVASPRSDPSLLAAELRDADVSVFPLDRNLNTSKLGSALRYCSSLMLGIPSWIIKRRSSLLVSAITERTEQWDALIALGEPSAQYVQGVSSTWHWDKFNVQSISLRQELSWRNGPINGLRDLVNLNATLRFERRFSRLASSISVTNSEEAHRYRKVAGRESVVLHSTVELPTRVERAPRKGTLLWLGSFGYRSNIAGLRQFLSVSWPDLEEKFELRIVGSAMSNSHIRWLTAYRNVTPLGYVEDLNTEISSAQLGIVPIWGGGGTKMKTLTMMASGLPTVTTVDGAEGIAVTDGVSAYISRSPSDFSSKVLEASADGSAEAVGVRGREVIRSNFTETGISAQYDQLLGVIYRFE